jgi:hypothetical protein
MLIADKKIFRCASLLIFVLVSTAIVMTFRHYGITWDEELQSQYGQAIVDYYLSSFRDQRYAEIYNLYLYGGMFDGLASLVDRYTPFNVYETRHLLNALFGLLGIWGTWRLATHIGDEAVGLIAAGLLVLTPMYYGHMFNNPKDIPYAAGIIWSLYFMSRFYQKIESRGGVFSEKSIILKLGIIFGLSLGVRVGGVMVLAFWFIGMLLPFRYLRTKLFYVCAVSLLSYLIMLVCWPWAQHSPIINPINALNEFRNFPHNVEVLLNGSTYMSTQLPWYYVPLYFSVQLPELLLFLLLAACVVIPVIWQKAVLFQKQTIVLMLLTIFVPVLYAMIFHPSLYDTVRHFLFVVPIMCILAALTARYGFVSAVGQFEQRWSRFSVGVGLLSILALFVITQIIIMMQLHPYEYIYANSFTGGVPGAYGRFELDYWGTSFKESAEKLRQYVANEGGVPPGKIYRIAICGPWDSAMIYMPPDFEPVVANEPAEFFLSTTRWMCQNMRQGKEIIRVERMGVPLSIVKDLR